jgi:hypothetical protein
MWSPQVNKRPHGSLRSERGFLQSSGHEEKLLPRYSQETCTVIVRKEKTTRLEDE